MSIPWIADAIYLSGESPLPAIDVSSVGFSVGAVLVALSLARLRVSDVLAVSRATILDSMSDAVMVLDPHSNVLYRNRAGGEYLELHGPQAAPETLTHARPLESTSGMDGSDGNPGHTTATWTDDGATFDLLLSPVVDADGQTLADVLVVRDVTDQRRVEAELRNSGLRLEQALEATVQALSAVVESRDPYTLGHQRRVTTLARAIAEELGLEDERMRGLCVAAQVHDVGKIQIPIEILSRPGRLSAGEFALVKEHAEAGYQILKGIEFPWPVAQIVRQHHEKLDGSGYPLGLSADEIGVEARILCVADVVEAMASDRPYRPALGVEAALEEVKRHRGRLFDLAVVDACVCVMTRSDFQLSV